MTRNGGDHEKKALERDCGNTERLRSHRCVRGCAGTCLLYTSGWTYGEGGADADMTAMASQALAPYNDEAQPEVIAAVSYTHLIVVQNGDAEPYIVVLK